MKAGSICAYLEKCIIFMNTGCDGKDYPDCAYKEQLKKDWEEKKDEPDNT